jgi:predicted dehydrogenase
MRTPFAIGVVGLDRGGADIARVFAELPQANLRWICDERPELLLDARRRFAYTESTSHVEDLLEDESLDAIAVSGPESARPRIATLALERDKHVFAPGLVARAASEVDALIDLAQQQDRCLLIAPARLFDPGIRLLHELIEVGRLGELYYLRSVRNDVVPQQGRDVLWWLGCEDAAIMLTILGDEPIDVSARAEAFRHEGLADVVSCHFRFATGIAGQLYLSAMEAQSEYRVVAVGDAATVVFDAYKTMRRLSIFRRPAARANRGDAVRSPYVEDTDFLTEACVRFLEAVARPRLFPIVGNHEVSSAISLVEAAQASIEGEGRVEAVGRIARTVGRAPDATPVIQLPVRRSS